MIPGLGPILVAGPLVAWIVAGLEGAVEVGALGALGAGLFSIGIPKNSIVKYETALKTDQFVLVAHGTAAEVAKAKDIIETTHPANYAVHAADAVASESIEELVEEGNAFEASIVDGVENAKDPDVSEVTTRQVAEDDVPEEYRNENDRVA
jgi:hypothetical protein